MANLGNPALASLSRNPMGPPPPVSDAAHAPVVKTQTCNKFNTLEGCKFGEKCYFAHGERELGRPIGPAHEPPIAPPMDVRFCSAYEVGWWSSSWWRRSRKQFQNELFV